MPKTPLSQPKVTAMPTSLCQGGAHISSHTCPRARAGMNCSLALMRQSATHVKYYTPSEKGWLPFPSAWLEPDWEFWVFLFLTTNLNHTPARAEEKGILERRCRLHIKPSLSLQHQGESEQTAGARANIWNRYMGAKHHRRRQHSSSFHAG